MTLSVRAATTSREAFSRCARNWRTARRAPPYPRHMDLTGITHITSRQGTTWDAEPGSVRTASLQTLTGRHDFLEFINGDERVFIAVADLMTLRGPAQRSYPD